MTLIIAWVDSLSPFIQGVLGSAVFAIIVWLSRYVVKLLTSLNKVLKKSRDIDMMTKYWVHKNYVNTNGLYFFTQGYLFIISESLIWLFRTIMVASYYFGVIAILNFNLIQLVFSAIVISFAYEGSTWLMDQSKEDAISKVDRKIKEEVLSKLGNPRDKVDLMLGDQEKEDNNTSKTTVEKIT
jgi:hypothetical protein